MHYKLNVLIALDTVPATVIILIASYAVANLPVMLVIVKLGLILLVMARMWLHKR